MTTAWIKVVRVAMAVAALGLFGSQASAEDRALLIGVGTYSPGSGANNLPGIDRDIAMMRTIAQKYGFKDSQIRVLMDSQATLEGMRRAIQEWLIQGVGPGDRALLYYSGHGAQIPDTNGDETDGLDEVLVPYDVKVTDRLTNVLVDDELGSLLAQIRSDRVVVVLDACHSGSATRGISDHVVKYLANPDPLVRVTIDAAKTRTRGLGGDDANPFDQSKGIAAVNYVALNASTDAELSAATSVGSAFTVGLFRAVEAAPSVDAVTARSLVTTAGTEISHLISGASVHHPQVDGSLARADQPLFSRGIVAVPQPPPTPPRQPQPPPQPRPAPPVANPPAATPPVTTPPVAAPPVRTLWDQLLGAAQAVPRRTMLTGVRTDYRAGELLDVSFDMPIDGYVNVFNVGEGLNTATVLFPNRYVSDNFFRAGTHVTLPAPGRYNIRLNLDAGKSSERNIVVAFITSRPLNEYQLGLGDAAFRNTYAPAMRAAEIIGPEADVDFAAIGQFVIRR